MEKSIIELLLEKLQLRYEQDDINKLNEDIAFLKKNNLSKISDRLLSQNKPHKFLETLTELNFTTQLLKGLPLKTNVNIEYEPNNTKRPIDLVIELNNIKYYIQIKSLSNSIRENKQNHIVREIRNQSKQIHCKREFNIRISEEFSKDNVRDLMDFIKSNLDKKDGEKFIFNGNNNVIAEIELLTTDKHFRNHLSLYSFGDMNAVNITGMSKEQIKSALEKAAGAFENISSDNSINLIVSEIKNDRLQAIDFAEALYGTEYSTFKNGKMVNHRDNDGLFLKEDFSKKIASVIVLHRKEYKLRSDYERAICCNPFYDYLRPITDLIHDKIIERFTWIDSGFFES
jgi:hypothetical protein